MKTSLIVNRNISKHQVGNNIFGGFIEHLERVVYTGIYARGHPNANAYDFRQDVAALVWELKMP